MKLSEAKSNPVVGADKNLLDTSAPKGNENNTEEIYQIFLQAATGGVETNQC